MIYKIGDKVYFKNELYYVTDIVTFGYNEPQYEIKNGKYVARVPSDCLKKHR